MSAFEQKLIKESTSLNLFKTLAESGHGDFVKAVVDLENKIMAIGSELHVDDEQFLLNQGSSQQDLWGINIYPEASDDIEDFIEFDSMINIRPSQNNKSRYVEDEGIRKRIIEVVKGLVDING